MKAIKVAFGIFTLATLLFAACKPAPEPARLKPKQAPLQLAPRGAPVTLPVQTPLAVPRERAPLPLPLPSFTPFRVPEAPRH
jgi:hypothetical protein